MGTKKQKCFDACPDQGLVRSRPAQTWQTTATEMAVAGMFQKSDARRYILIHGSLAQDSQEVKTNNSNKPTSKQTTHQRWVDLWSHLSLFCLSPTLPEVYAQEWERVCVEWYASGLFKHLQKSVKTVLSWERKEVRVWIGLRVQVEQGIKSDRRNVDTWR